MLMKVHGKTSWPIFGIWAVSFVFLILAAGSGRTADKAPTPAANSPRAGSDIAFSGKFFCSLKRQVIVPFKGVISSLAVKPGQRVAAGEVLARYRLAPEAALQIQQRLASPQIKDLEIKLAEVERDLAASRNKQRELTQLARNKLAATEGKAEADREVQLLEKQKASVQDRLAQARQLSQEDRALLKVQLGNPVRPGQVPQEAALIAPIDGYVIWISPNLHEGEEMDAGSAAFQVGVMDPMLVRAQAFEIESQQLKLGDVAEVSLESQPERKFEGHLRRLSWAPLASTLDQPSYYEMELTVPNPDLFLKEGLKARVVFHKSR